MPPPVEPSRLRRVAQQSIMWIILGATVGMAALVDRAGERLGAAYTVGEVTLRLPSGWVRMNAEPQRIVLRERGTPTRARLLSVGIERSPSALAWFFAGNDDELHEESVELSFGKTARLRVVRLSDYQDPGVLEVQAAIPTGSGRPLVISLRQVISGNESDVELNIRLLKRILATVKPKGASD